MKYAEDQLFISCPYGFESILVQELNTLGYIPSEESAGGIYINYQNFEQILKLNLYLRTASRVLLPIKAFKCRDKKDLYEASAEIDWSRFFTKMQTLAIDVTLKEHKTLVNSLFCAQVVKDAICDQLVKKYKFRPNVDTQNPRLRFHLHIENEQAVLSFDTSAKPLHMRGIRQTRTIAPIRENLAAALLLHSRYTSQEILCDPCAGSGTFLIEAAMIATNTPAGIYRQWFGFFEHYEFAKKQWEDFRKSAWSTTIPLKKGMIYGYESDRKTFQTLKECLEFAGFQHEIEVALLPFQNAIDQQATFIISNPPYGVRLTLQKDLLQNLYKELGDFMKQKTTKPARGYILTQCADAVKFLGLRTKSRLPVFNGGMECRFLEYELY